MSRHQKQNLTIAIPAGYVVTSTFN